MTPLRRPILATLRRALGCGLALALAAVCTSAAAAAPPAASAVNARDRPLDAGGAAWVEWTAPDDPDRAGWFVYRSLAEDEIARRRRSGRVAAAGLAAEETREALLASLAAEGVAPEDAERRAEIAARSAGAAAAAAWVPEAPGEGGIHWELAGIADAAQDRFLVDGLSPGTAYRFAIQPYSRDGARGPISIAPQSVEALASPIDAKRLPLFLILALICGTVLLFIARARKGRPIQVRAIAGLSAVEEAVGRATEMGRSILYINGIQDMDDLQTVAGVNILGRVSRIAAEYDAKVEVPTTRSLVMTAAREAVQGSYLAAGRSDNYNPDLIYYVTDEQFGFVAYVSGMMVREKPAACFYMGAFFAESLILAETGNSIGAIQIAGTAMPSQLPFFVAACDYTLIGEEFFAASAYLSGDADQLGSLKGQDVGKALVAAMLLVGVLLATLAGLLGTPGLEAAVEFYRDTVLGS